MAKGFTVKAKNPVKKKPAPEFDYAKAKEMITVSYTHLRAHET